MDTSDKSEAIGDEGLGCDWVADRPVRCRSPGRRRGCYAVWGWVSWFDSPHSSFQVGVKRERPASVATLSWGCLLTVRAMAILMPISWA